MGAAISYQSPSDASAAKRERLAALGDLHGVFQPIVAVAKGEIIAHEGLIRGPTNYHLPTELFAAALDQGCSDELEYRASEVILQSFAAASASGLLFVNFSAQAVMHLGSKRGCQYLLQVLGGCEVPARKLVIEITEHERVVDHAAMIEAADRLRGIGVGIALDDFGDGGSSLRLWAEIEPEYVKIDRYFCHDIHKNGRKVQTVKAMLRLAENFGSRIVAEGIEQHADLRVVRDLGVDYVQGYALGYPAPQPTQAIPTAARAVLDAVDIAVFPQLRRAYSPSLTAARLVNPAPPVSKSMNNQKLLEIFQADADLPAVAVLSNGLPVGIVNRRRFLERYTLPYFPEVYGRKSCTALMESNPLLIEISQPLEELIHVLTADDQRYLNDGFVLVDAGKYVGIGTAEQLVRSVTELRIEAARHANPLTFLPGNIPTSEHVRRLLLGGTHFCASYCDLNHFKAFNDRFGYWQGDKMIRLLASVITHECDPERDFAGHVGGDDFMVLLQSEDWQTRCARMIETFNAAAPALYDPLTRERGYIESEDRQGNPCRFPLTTLSIGALQVAPADFTSPEDVASAAAAAKHQAKRSNAGLFVLDSGAAARDFERAYLRESA